MKPNFHGMWTGMFVKVYICLMPMRREYQPLKRQTIEKGKKQMKNTRMVKWPLNTRLPPDPWHNQKDLGTGIRKLMH